MSAHDLNNESPNVFLHSNRHGKDFKNISHDLAYFRQRWNLDSVQARINHLT